MKNTLPRRSIQGSGTHDWLLKDRGRSAQNPTNSLNRST